VLADLAACGYPAIVLSTCAATARARWATLPTSALLRWRPTCCAQVWTPSAPPPLRGRECAQGLPQSISPPCLPYFESSKLESPGPHFSIVFCEKPRSILMCGARVRGPSGILAGVYLSAVHTLSAPRILSLPPYAHLVDSRRAAAPTSPTYMLLTPPPVSPRMPHPSVSPLRPHPPPRCLPSGRTPPPPR
jgi:hypothetical protein